ncbi:MAG: acyl-CoA thioesterase [Candidatus Krumholzibacteria bacterium]|nr:acyl-CoA thioesterase [Candidatus Krumholzibacteria bacterium]
MKYATEFAVRFGDIDQAGVVYYPRFFHYFHQAFESWFEDALGVSYSELVVAQDLGFPTVRLETEFKAPLRYGDRIRIELELVDIGKKSLTVRYTAIRLSDGVISARADIKTVAVRNDGFTSVTIPEQWRQRFERFRAGPDEDNR